MSVDVRTRDDGPAPPLDALRFFADELHLSCTLHMAQPPMAREKLRAVREKTPVTVSQPGRSY